jgi:hypothetical protein
MTLFERFETIFAIEQCGHLASFLAIVPARCNDSKVWKGFGNEISLTGQGFLGAEQIGIEVSYGFGKKLFAQVPAIDTVVGSPVTDVETHDVNPLRLLLSHGRPTADEQQDAKPQGSKASMIASITVQMIDQH